MPLEARIGEHQMSGLSERAWSWLLTLVCLIVVFSNLSGEALFEPDEGRNAEKAREILLLRDWVTPHENFLPVLDKPIPFYWLVAFSFKLFGVSEWAARLPSVLAALGCLFLVYRFARRHWGVWEALWSCLVLVTSFQFFVFARLVIFDMSLTFFISWALFSFYKAIRSDATESRRLHALLMYAALGAGTLIKGPIALVIPGMVIFFYLFLTRRWFLLKQIHLLLGALVYLAIVTPWYFAVEMKNPGYLRYFLWEEHVLRYLTPHFGRTKNWYYFFMVVGVGFLPWTFLLPLTVRDLWRRAFHGENLLLVLWAILPFVFFSASNAKLPQYILPIYPALALLTGRTVTAQLQEATRRLSILYVIWIFPVGFLLYLVIGAAWPTLLATQVRAATIQNLPLLAACAAVLIVIFAVFIIGQSRKVWQDRGAAYLWTSTALALFLVALGQVMATASLRRASKSLAKQSASVIDREARLVFYGTYIEGIPFYLRIDKPIWLVQAREKEDVMGSFYLGERRPAALGLGQVLFTFEEFARQWKRNEIIFGVFIKEKNLIRLSSDIGASPRVLSRYNDYVLVTNR
jgi:4-amino-4-deoxy-L-arabinose transferase-like glycosyltransferase